MLLCANILININSLLSTELESPQLPTAEESNDGSQDQNILLGTSSDELGKNSDSDDVVLTDNLPSEQELMETDNETEETSGSDVNRCVIAW